MRQQATNLTRSGLSSDSKPYGEHSRSRDLGAPHASVYGVVRRQVALPAPILGGRRLWSRDHLVQAAQLAALLYDELRTRPEREVIHG